MKCAPCVSLWLWVALLGLGAGCQESSQQPWGQAARAPAAASVAARGANGAELDARLLQAIKEGRSGQVEALLAQGAAVQAKTKSGKTALHVACEAGKLSIVQV